jgi:hypothetical protein
MNVMIHLVQQHNALLMKFQALKICTFKVSKSILVSLLSIHTVSILTNVDVYYSVYSVTLTSFKLSNSSSGSY